MQRFYFRLLILLLFFGLFRAGTAFAAVGPIVSIATGGVTGVYYPAGASICRLINQGRNEHGIRCAAESTDGSVFNLEAIAAGSFDMAIVQSDWQYHAYHGSNKFTAQGANRELRTLFSLHAEPFTVVARAASGITKFSDLKGKRVNIGNPGSGQRGTMDVVMEALGWQIEDFSAAAELPSDEQAEALCRNQIDAIVYTVGHPSDSIREATASCATRLVSVTGPVIEKLVADNDYYLAASIPGGMYRGTDSATATFGVGATFVTSSQLADETAYQIVKTVFENLTAFRKLHPAFARLAKARMITDGFSAPLHSGAVRYYKEVGLM